MLRCYPRITRRQARPCICRCVQVRWESQSDMQNGTLKTEFMMLWSTGHFKGKGKNHEHHQEEEAAECLEKREQPCPREQGIDEPGRMGQSQSCNECNCTLWREQKVAIKALFWFNLTFPLVNLSSWGLTPFVVALRSALISLRSGACVYSLSHAVYIPCLWSCLGWARVLWEQLPVWSGSS